MWRFKASSSANLESHSLQKYVPFSVRQKRNGFRLVLGGANRFLGNYLEKYLTTAGIGVLRVHLRHLLGQTRGGRVGTDIRVLWRVGATGRAF